jgi:hypothetical protein
MAITGDSWRISCLEEELDRVTNEINNQCELLFDKLYLLRSSLKTTDNEKEINDIKYQLTNYLPQLQNLKELKNSKSAKKCYTASIKNT